MGKTEVIERAEREIETALSVLGLIGDEYVGSVTIHIHRGRICDFEKHEKGLKKKLSRQHDGS